MTAHHHNSGDHNFNVDRYEVYGSAGAEKK